MQDTMRTEIKKRIAPERIPGVYRDTGAGIYLRLMTREDTDRIVAWRNSDAVRKNFIYQALFTRESHENWIRTHVETGDVVQMIICDLANDKPLGSVYIRDIADLVVVRQQDTAEEGQIVVALIENEATLKRYYIDKRRKKIRLHPENDGMKDMFFDDVAIQGVAVKILKDIY